MHNNMKRKQQNLLSLALITAGVTAILFAITVVSGSAASEEDKQTACIAIPVGVTLIVSSLAIYLDKDPFYKKNPLDHKHMNYYDEKRNR